MPIVQSRALSLSVSSPKGCGTKTIHRSLRDVTVDLPSSAVAPIQLTNGCSEAELKVDSDDVRATNFLRKHYLEHFGHRDLSGLLQDYSKDATIIHNVTSYDNQHNGGIQEQHMKKKFHGIDEIRDYYEGMIFQIHNDPRSTFRLESITVANNNAIVNWSAKTPTLSIVDGVDRFVFTPTKHADHDSSKCTGQPFLITKQFFSCETHERENILKMERRRTVSSFSSSASSSERSNNDYSGFFE